MLTSTDLVSRRDPAAAGPAARRAVVDIASLAACAASWLLLRPYYGLDHDAVIYMGRGLADLDPAGVGRDIMFRYDGQSQFSVFSELVDGLIPLLGLAGAAKSLALAGCVLWFAALVALASRLANGTALWAMLLLVACFDSAYGGLGVFRFAEPFATPRPFAEAFALAAFAALLSERRLAAILLLALAAVFHPILAAPACLVALFFEGARDRRVRLAALAGALALIVAALAGAPLLDRLVAPIDPQWAAIVAARSDYVFLSNWPTSAWLAILRQASTLLLAASIAPPRVRLLLLCILAAAAAGVSAAFLFGDLLLRELPTQAQSWRALWLVAVFSPLALGLAAPALWREGAPGRIVLALLLLGWILRAAPESAFLCTLALVAWRLRERWSGASLALLERALFALCGLSALAVFGAALWFAREFCRTAPSDRDLLASILRAGEPLYLPTLFVALAILVAAFRPRPLHAVAVTAIAAPLAAHCWASEPVPLASHDIRVRELRALVAAREGEVLWLDEKLAPWVWLGRANWASQAQGAGALFSRRLALVWRERTELLRDLGWVAETALTPRTDGAVDFPPFTRGALERLCAREDAPALVIGAVKAPDALPPGLGARFWRGPTRYALHLSGAAPEWTPIERHAIFDCADYRPSGG